MAAPEDMPANVASTADSGSLRARPRTGGGIQIGAPGNRVVGVGFGIAFGLISAALVLGAVRPPGPSGIVGWMMTLLLIGGSAGFSALGFHLARLGSSRLDIDAERRIVACVGSRWSTTADGSVAVRAVTIERGPLVRHSETIDRRTWIVRLDCGDTAVAVLQAWHILGVRRKAARLAESIGVPLEDATMDDEEAEELARRL